MLGVGSFGSIIFGDLLVLQFFQLEQHPAQVLLDGLLFDAQFNGGLHDELPAVPGDVEVERVHEHALLGGRQHVDLHLVEGQVLRQAPHSIAPVAQLHHHFVAA